MKSLQLALFLAMVAAPAHAEDEPDPTTAAIMSFFLPGVGEWYNRSYQDPLPIAEFCVGTICCFVWFSSIVDAARGVDDDRIRFDFWSSSLEGRSPIDEGGNLR